MSVDVEVRTTVRKLQNELRLAQSKNEFVECLLSLKEFCSAADETESVNTCKKSQRKQNANEERSECFFKNHYVSVCKLLLNKMTLENVGQLNSDEYTQLFLNVFLHGQSDKAFLALMDFISASRFLFFIKLIHIYLVVHIHS